VTQIVHGVAGASEAAPRRFTGGAWVPISGSGMPIGFTSPMMILEANGEGIKVSARWKLVVGFCRLGYWAACRAQNYPVSRMRNMFQAAAASGFKEPTWTSAWDDIERATFDPYSVILISRRGHPCWFNAKRRRAMREIAEIIESHGVPIVHVKSTYDERRSMWR
jgi:hypothetical protein